MPIWAIVIFYLLALSVSFCLFAIGTYIYQKSDELRDKRYFNSDKQEEQEKEEEQGEKNRP